MDRENTTADGKKKTYVEDATIGTIVAFTMPNGKVKSAKIIRKSTKRRKLMLETGYKARFIVSYDDIVWVRTGDKWPKYVFKLLKGEGQEDGERE